MTMMESTTTIDLTETAAPQPTSIDEIHIETIEERLHIFKIYFLRIFLIQKFDIVFTHTYLLERSYCQLFIGMERKTSVRI